MWYKQEHDSIYLIIYAKPRAKSTKVVGIYNDALCISLKAQTKEGEANKELLRFLADYFSVPQKAIKLLRGKHARKKTIHLPINIKIREFIAMVSHGLKQP